MTNPLTVLEKVFGHLTVEDLKTCRQICKSWCQEATVAMRKSVGIIPVGTPSALKELISITKSSFINPFTKFNFSSHFFSLPSCENTFQEFLFVFGPSLEVVALTLDKESDPCQTLGDFDLHTSPIFPKLSFLTLIGHGLDLSTCTQNGQLVPPIFQIMTSLSQRLETLSIIMDESSRQSMRNLTEFISATSPFALKGLHFLEIYAPVGDKEILHLTGMPFRLKSLKCDFHRSCFLPENLKAFLSAQSPTLEYLKFDNYYGTSCYTVALPKMPNLTTLKIDGRSELSSKEVNFLPFSYSKQFPGLNKLVLGGSIEMNKCWKILFPEDEVVQSLKHLKLTARFIDPLWVERIGFIFPHLEKLSFLLTPRNETLARVVFNNFQSLKHLTVSFHQSMGNADHLFTGFEKQLCENLGAKASETLQKLRAAPRTVGLKDLKMLKTLRLKTDAESFPNHISDITVNYAFLQMENLEQVRMPKFELSPQVLHQLEMKCRTILT